VSPHLRGGGGREREEGRGGRERESEREREGLRKGEREEKRWTRDIV
jgi:hypothetical protein